MQSIVLAPRLVTSQVMRLPATPEQVFPLLCPVREYEWIRTWQCRLVHCASGVAELDCIFETDMPGEEGRLWQVSRYEPPSRIEFVCFLHQRATVAMRLHLQAAADGGTELAWHFVVTALSEAGTALLAPFTPETLHQRMAGLETQLRHFLTTGDML